MNFVESNELNNKNDYESNQSKNGLLNLKIFNNDLSVQIKYLNEDCILLGFYGIFELINGVVFLDLAKLASICCKIINEYKEKLKLIDEIEDKKKYLNTDLIRIEKLYRKQLNENEVIRGENYRLKENIKDLEKKVIHLNQKLKTEQNNIRNVRSSVDKEKSQMQNQKYKMEKELECLKERMNKLLSDPKRQYSNMEINTFVERRTKSTLFQKVVPTNLISEEIKEDMSNYLRHQVEELILENRQIREQLVCQLSQLRQLCCDDNIRTSFVNCDNSESSVHSSNSDISLKSNETFVISNPPLPVLDERIFLELQFSVVKDDIVQSFEEYYQKIITMIKDKKIYNNECSVNTKSISSSEGTTAAFVENMNRMQKEIFQLRKRLTDYEELIQTKDSLLENAIQQRIRRGSLVSENQI